MQEETEYINVYGARVHNLKDIDAEIPRNSLTVITGLSGSGKSSLAFDTIFAEGQRRYIETFSAYARNFLGNLERPDVDKITGLSPVISIEQKTTNKNPRSTVGTTTEIYDYLRLLYARAGEAYSYLSGEKMVKYTEEQILELILNVYKGKTLGIVGESGCGKSTLGRTILKLIEPTAGHIIYDGKDITSLNIRKMRPLRREMQIIFQDPYSSIVPRKSVIETISEYMFIHKSYPTRREIMNRAVELMDMVGLARRYADAYPHELDGGRRQRIGIARALSLQPRFIVCDEPVSALDMSIQAQILNLLMDLQDELNLSYMFVTHDLSVVKHISDQIMVMYLGTCIEFASSDELFQKPLHPYTKALLAAIPEPDLESRKKGFQLIRGEVSSPIDPKPGCRFAGRCEHCMAQCLEKTPEYVETEPGHFVACHLVNGR